jgi:hypothetical protein
MTDQPETGGPPEGRSAELWCPSLRQWVHGFSVLGHARDGVVVRRHSDDTVLPVHFDAADVRILDDHA